MENVRAAVSGWAQEAKKYAGWLVVVGMVNVVGGFAAMGVILGFLQLRDWPLSGLWAVGTLVGVNLLFTGFSFISVGSAARGVAKRVA